MTTQSFERYGLTGNPFRDLASETLEDVEIFHVNLQIDEALRAIKEEVLDRENRAVVGLVGPLGVGKTERLRLAQSDARNRKATAIYVDSPATLLGMLGLVGKGVESSVKLGGFARTFSPPPGYRAVTALERAKPGKFDPLLAGRAIAEALNENAPAFLLLNDIHNLAAAPEAHAFARMFGELVDGIKPGVLVAFGSYSTYWAAIAKSFPALASRINRTFVLPALAAEEAGLLLAKKLLAKRLVEELDPLYPFDRESVGALNDAAHGNPRRLLELADLALEHGVVRRAYRVDRDIVRSALQNQPPPNAPPTGPAGRTTSPPGSAALVSPKPLSSPTGGVVRQGTDSP